jgi:hypothetical protein
VIIVSNKEQINLLNEVEELIDSMHGLDDMLMHKIGISPEEITSPTKETIKKLRDYQKKLEKENIKSRRHL